MSLPKKTFLFVDDDEDDRNLFSDTLKMIDSEIITYEAINGKEALTLLTKKTQHLPDVIFLDINMPAMSGWECLKKIKENEHLKNIPVVILSTSSNIRDVGIAVELDAAFYWVKPTSFLLIKDILSLFATKTIQDLRMAISGRYDFKGLFYTALNR